MQVVFILLYGQFEGRMEKTGMAENSVEHSGPQITGRAAILAVIDRVDPCKHFTVAGEVPVMTLLASRLFRASEKGFELILRRSEPNVRVVPKREYGFINCHGDHKPSGR
jgi:hypothetical protein